MDGKSDLEYYDKSGKWWPSYYDCEMARQKKKELREKVNGPEPWADWRCECGAKKDTEFPNIHSSWCPAHKKSEC